MGAPAANPRGTDPGRSRAGRPRLESDIRVSVPIHGQGRVLWQNRKVRLFDDGRQVRARTNRARLNIHGRCDGTPFGSGSVVRPRERTDEPFAVGRLAHTAPGALGGWGAGDGRSA